MINKDLGKKCRKGYEIQVLKCGCGYYIGTVTEDGEPMCRLSTKYTKTAEDAKHLDTNRIAEENMFCNGGYGCLNMNNIVIHTCPKCGREYRDYPAISRRDGSEICPRCGEDEAFEDLFK